MEKTRNMDRERDLMASMLYHYNQAIREGLTDEQRDRHVQDFEVCKFELKMIKQRVK